MAKETPREKALRLMRERRYNGNTGRVPEDDPRFDPLTMGNRRAGRKPGSGAGVVAGYQVRRHGRRA